MFELDRVLGPEAETRFSSTNDDAAILAEHLEELKALPSAIGYEEMLRRLGFSPPDAPPGMPGDAQ